MILQRQSNTKFQYLGDDGELHPGVFLVDQDDERAQIVKKAAIGCGQPHHGVVVTVRVVHWRQGQANVAMPADRRARMRTRA